MLKEPCIDEKPKKDNFYSFEMFDHLRKEPFESKLERSRALVRKAFLNYGDKVAVACSFGKDSTVVLHLALQENPNVLVMFCNTGVEYPETYAFRDKLIKEWNLNFIETKPVKSFWQCVKEYGYPRPRHETIKGIKKPKKGRPKYQGGTPACCKFLKHIPASRCYKEHAIKAVLRGLTIEEAYNRRINVLQRGMDYIKKTDGIHYYDPITFWTEKEVWKYIRENNLPYNSYYDRGFTGQENRVGCMFCTGFLSWKKRLGKVNPAMLRKILRDMGQATLEAK